MKSYIIHLIRHGMTTANIEGRYAGNSEVPLCDEGIKELNALRDKYDYKCPELIFSSPLCRCVDTAKILFGEEREITIVPGLHEMDFGDFEGKTAEQLIGDPDYTAWARHGARARNGESNSEFATRVCTAFVQTIRDILKTGKTNAAIVTHGGVIMMLLSVYGIPERESIDWLCPNGRGFTIRVTPSLWMRTGKVEVLSEYPFGSADEENHADISHLAGSLNDEIKPEFDDEFEYEDGYLWADVDEDEQKDGEK